ncbi:MAG: ATP-binding protein [bacterium]|nr:ATP-binding protein [bacterium]
MSSSQVNRRTRTDDFALLSQVSQMLTSLDRDKLLDRVIEVTAAALDAHGASLLIPPDAEGDWTNVIFREEGGKLVSLGRGDEGIKIARRVLDQGLAGWVVRNRKAALITDTQQDSRWLTFPDSNSGARSALCVPFVQNDRVLAALTLIHTQPGHFDDNDLQLMTIVANQLTVGLRNAQLFNRMLQQRQQLEAVLRAIPDFMCVLDETGHILQVNDEAARILDMDGDADNLMGKTMRSLAHLDTTLMQIAEITSSPARIGQHWSFEVRSEQQRKDYLASVSVWNSATLNMPDRAGYVVIMRDITTMRDLARFKDEMLRMASHDLRSPLALIVGYVNLVAMDTTDKPEIQEYLQVIERSTGKMRGLLDDLLRVEQIRNSPLELHQQVDYRALITTVLNDMRPLVDGKQQDVSAELRLDDLHGIRVNPFLIREAMENLITNAIKYTPEGGKIRVKSYRQTDRLYFMVEDTGIGIPRDVLPRLFQSFFRVHQPGTERVEGRGLGLSLVKTIIERHQGEVWVESEVGHGSTFGFWIPI